MKKSVLSFVMVFTLCIFVSACRKSEVDMARYNSMVNADIVTAKQIGKIVEIAIEEDAEIKEQISNAYKKCSDVDGLIEKFLAGADKPLSLENGEYYIKTENDLVNVAIATSEEEANEIKDLAIYDGSKAGIAYISQQ